MPLWTGQPLAYPTVQKTGAAAVVLLQITAMPRSGKQKETFYRLLVEKLQAACGIAPEDVIVSYLGNGNDDWSFGMGEAQFVSGRLRA
jgi:tautomerase-like protein